MGPKNLAFPAIGVPAPSLSATLWIFREGHPSPVGDLSRRDAPLCCRRARLAAIGCDSTPPGVYHL